MKEFRYHQLLDQLGELNKLVFMKVFLKLVKSVLFHLFAQGQIAAYGF